LEVSPAKKMEVCKIIHSAVRTTVSLLQKCHTEVKVLVYSERGCKEGRSVSDTIVNLAALLDVQCTLITPASTDCSELKNGNWYVFLYFIYIYSGCPGGNVPDFGRMFLKLKYTDVTKNTYIRS
jgi:hypothetical protein